MKLPYREWAPERSVHASEKQLRPPQTGALDARSHREEAGAARGAQQGERFAGARMASHHTSWACLVLARGRAPVCGEDWVSLGPMARAHRDSNIGLREWVDLKLRHQSRKPPWVEADQRPAQASGANKSTSGASGGHAGMGRARCCGPRSCGLAHPRAGQICRSL